MDLLYCISVLLRIGAILVIVATGIRLRSWRLGFLALLMGWLGLRKALTLLRSLGDPVDFSFHFTRQHFLDELPGHVVSLLMFLGSLYLAKLFLEIERNQKILQRSEEFNRRLVEALPGGVLQVDPKGRVERCNPEGAVMLEMENAASLGARVDDFTAGIFREDGSSCPPAEHPLNRCLRSGEAVPPMTLGRQLKTGQITWAVLRAVPLLETTGKQLIGAVLTMLDVTHRKRAEALIEGRSRVLELIAQGRGLKEVLAVLAGTIQEQVHGSLVSVLLLNEAGTRLHIGAAPGLPAEYNADVEGYLIGPLAGTCGTAAYTRERVVDEDIASSPRWNGISDRALVHGLCACWSEPIFASNGRVLGTFAVYFRSVRQPTGEETQLLNAATHVAGIAIERHRTEEALRRSEASLARTEAFALVIPAQINLDGTWRKTTPMLGDLLGYGEADLPRTRFAELVHPGDRDRVLALTGRLLGGEVRTFDTEVRLMRHDGFFVWGYINASLVSDDLGRPVFFLTYIRDVTERKRAEQALRESEERLKLAMRAGNLGSWDWDIKQNRIVWSEETETMFGLPPRSFAGTYEAYLALVHPDDRSEVVSQLNEALEHPREYHVEHRIFDRDGDVRWLETWGRLVAGGQREPARMLGTFQDITERKRAALRLEQARERLQALSRELLQVQEAERGDIARELREEIGALLTNVKLHLQNLQRVSDYATLMGRLRESVVLVESALQQLRELTLDLRPPLLDDLGLESAVRWYVDQQTQHSALNSRFSTENLDGRFDPVIETACFRVAQEAIDNVIRHAHASKLTVELKRADGWLHLTVRDNGRGFDIAEVRARAGSQKSVGILRLEERVALVGGRLEHRSKTHQGTEVSAWFPLNQARSSEARTGHTSAA